jgi:hypothetical protein
MHRNDIRALGIGVTAGLIAGLVPIMAVEMDLETKVPDAVRRWRLSAADRAEYDRLQQAMADKRTAAAHADEQREIGLRANFHPGLVTGKHPVALADLSIAQLIDEIDYAKSEKRAAVAEERYTAHRPMTARWSDQIEALRSEFKRRDVRRMTLVDRARCAAAHYAVFNHDDEYPPVTPPQLANFGVPKFPPYPAFEGPDTADEAQTITTFEE